MFEETESHRTQAAVAREANTQRLHVQEMPEKLPKILTSRFREVTPIFVVEAVHSVRVTSSAGDLLMLM